MLTGGDGEESGRECLKRTFINTSRDKKVEETYVPTIKSLHRAAFSARKGTVISSSELFGLGYESKDIPNATSAAPDGKLASAKNTGRLSSICLCCGW